MLLWMSSILKKIAKPVENHAVLEYFEGSALHRVAPVAPPPLADAKHGMQTRKKDHNTSEGGRAAGQKKWALAFGVNVEGLVPSFLLQLRFPWTQQVVVKEPPGTCTKAKEERTI